MAKSLQTPRRRTVNNVAPVANAGVDQAVDEGEAVNLSGSFVDPGSADSHTFLWHLVSASNGQAIADAATTSLSFVPADNGTYTFEYTVTDDDGAAQTDSVVVTANNVAPVANAGTDQTVDEGTSVSLNGNYTDAGSADGHTFLWHLVNATNGQIIGDAATQSLSFTPNDNGTYTFEFTVTDDDFASHTDSVVVAANNVAPVLGLTGVSTANEGETKHFTFTSSDPGDDTISVAVISGGVVGTVSNVVIDSLTGDGSFDVTFSDGPATSTVSVQVQDSDAAASNGYFIDVTVANVAPTVANPLVNRTAIAGTLFSVSVPGNTFQEVAADPLTLSATKGDGSPLPAWLSFSGGVFSGTPAETDFGAFDIKVMATDDAAANVSDTFTLTVVEITPPTVTLTAPALTNDATPSVIVTATDAGSGVVGVTVRLDVDLNNDGDFSDTIGGRSEQSYSTATLSSGTATFDVTPALATGTYTLRARVADASNNVGTSSTSTVVIDTIAPSATLTPSTAGPTNASGVIYTVNFSELVSHLSTDDFSLTTTGLTTGTIASVSASSGTSVTVTVNNITGDGTLRLNIKANTDITDTAGNVASSANGGTVTIDQTAPVADIIDVTPGPRATSVSSVQVTFSESVTGVSLGDFTLSKNGLPVALTGVMLTGSGATYLLNGFDLLTNGEGAYLLTLASSGTGIVDAAGNEQNTGATDDWFLASTIVTTVGNTIAITDIGGTNNGGNTDDNIIISRDPANPNNILITFEGKTTSVPFTGVTNLVINGGAGDDTVTIDASNGDLPFTITFNGGTGGHDVLNVINFDAGLDAFTATYANVNDGNIQLKNNSVVMTTIVYTGLEPITIDGSPTEVIFNLPSTNDIDVVLSAIDASTMMLSGSTFEDTTFSIADAASITINTNAGNDNVTVASVAANFTGLLTINGGAGNDILDASSSPLGVTLLGGGGNDTLTGSDFDDSFSGGAGNDSLKGGSGDDTLSVGSGNDLLNGEAGTDFYAETVTGSLTITNTKLIGGNLGSDVRLSLECVEFSGDSGNNLLDASQYTLGSVTLHGMAGNDTLLGGSSDDLLDGGDGIDQVKQTSGQTQTLTGTQLTGNGADTLTSIERANLTAKSALGNTVDASAFNGLVTLTGGNGPDRLLSSIMGGLLNGGTGRDTITGGIGYDYINGGTGDDSLSGGDGLDTIIGGTGNDTIDGGVGADLIYGSEGRDKIFGGDGNDTIDGGTGDDTISGGADNDKITGGIGNDAMSGGAGRDFLDGQGGNDTLLGDAGDDTLRGGKGRDVCLSGEGVDNVDGGEERDTITGSPGNDVVSTQTEIDDAFTFDFGKLLA